MAKKEATKKTEDKFVRTNFSAVKKTDNQPEINQDTEESEEDEFD
jgi:hypothetical protein